MPSGDLLIFMINILRDFNTTTEGPEGTEVYDILKGVVDPLGDPKK